MSEVVHEIGGDGDLLSGWWYCRKRPVELILRSASFSTIRHAGHRSVLDQEKRQVGTSRRCYPEAPSSL